MKSERGIFSWKIFNKFMHVYILFQEKQYNGAVLFRSMHRIFPFLFFFFFETETKNASCDTF